MPGSCWTMAQTPISMAGMRRYWTVLPVSWPPDGQAAWNGYVPPVDRITTKEDAIRAAQAALSSGDEKSDGQYRELGLRIQLLWHYAEDNVWLVVCYGDRDAETVGESLEMAFSGEDASLIGAWWGE